jgi:hypothetical protein
MNGKEIEMHGNPGIMLATTDVSAGFSLKIYCRGPA